MIRKGEIFAETKIYVLSKCWARQGQENFISQRIILGDEAIYGVEIKRNWKMLEKSREN